MTATTTKRFAERMGGRVDRAAGIIRGVKLLGRTSRNGRQYSEAAMREAAPKYSGIKVYLDHPEREKLSDDRKFRDWVGIIENAEFRGGSIFGDIRLRKASEHFEAIMEAAEEFGGFFGMSHVADGESRVDRTSGEEIIENIQNIYSVDIVTEPATAAGLFESTADRKEIGEGLARIRMMIHDLLKHKAIASSLDTVEILEECTVMLDGFDKQIAQAKAEALQEESIQESMQESIQEIRYAFAQCQRQF